MAGERIRHIIAVTWAKREDSSSLATSAANPGSDEMADTAAVRAYNSWWQARSDTWARLDEAGGQLAAAAPGGAPADEMLGRDRCAARRAGPGRAVLGVPRAGVAAPGPGPVRGGRLRPASARWPAGSAGPWSPSPTGTAPSGWPRRPSHRPGPARARRAASPARPYFEVLVVETLSPAQEHALREEVRGWRRPGRPLQLRAGHREQRRGGYAGRPAERRACRPASSGGGSPPRRPATCPAWPSSPTPASPPNWPARPPRTGPRRWPGDWPCCGPSWTCT